MSVGIAIFAYDRPVHLKRVLTNVRKNDVDHLYIFSDGPGGPRDKAKVECVRDVIKNIDWCRTTTFARETNWGMAESVVSGIERVFDDHDRMIMIEDDCLPAPGFIDYMKKALKKYDGSEAVMSVTGYVPPIEIPKEYPYDAFFSYRSNTWGWGTWHSAWEHYERKSLSRDGFSQRKMEIKDLCKKSGRDIIPMLQQQFDGEIDSYHVWWRLEIAKRSGVCLYPTKSLIRNIGHDGTGTHSVPTDKFDTDLPPVNIEEFELPDEVFVDQTIHRRLNRFFGAGRYRYPKRVVVKSLQKFGLWPLFKRLREYSEQ